MIALNKKKLLIAAAFVALAVLLGVGGFLGVRFYRENHVRFTVKDTLPEGEGKKATVILLGGQSNASGCSRDDYLQKNVTAEEYAAMEAGYDNVYINYLSGANTSGGFVKCSVRQGEIEAGFGPELGLAQYLHEQYPDRLFFIIKCAWGGTNLFEQWLSPSSDGKTGKLYQSFAGFVESSMDYLIDKNYDVSIAGMCWMQGESDSFSVENGTDYEVHLTNFIGDLRKRLSRYTADDGMAFVDATIADNPVYWVYCDLVNASKEAVAATSPLNLLIDTNQNGLTCAEEPEGEPDMAHYDSLSQLKLGRLFGEALEDFLN